VALTILGLVSHHHGGYSSGIMFLAVLNGFIALLSIALGAVNAIFSWMCYKSSTNPEYDSDEEFVSPSDTRHFFPSHLWIPNLRVKLQK
jgi:hypothetical protein